MTPFSASFSRKVADRTESKTASTATFEEPLLLLERDAEAVRDASLYPVGVHLVHSGGPSFSSSAPPPFFFGAE